MSKAPVTEDRIDFGISLVAVVATHLFAVHSFDLLLSFTPAAVPYSAWPILLGSGATTIGVAGLLRGRQSAFRKWWWLGLGGIVLTHYIGLAVHHLLPRDGHPHWSTPILLAALLPIWPLYQIFCTIRKEVASQIEADTDSIAPPLSLDGLVSGSELQVRDDRTLEARVSEISAMVLFLSSFWKNPDQRYTAPIAAPEAALKDPLAFLESFPPDIGFHNPKSLEYIRQTNWYPAIRAIGVHLTNQANIRQKNINIHVLTSKDGARPGTFRQFETFQAWVNRLAGPGRFQVQVLHTTAATQGVTFDDVGALSEVLLETKRAIRAADAEGLILLDITGGSAAYSAIAGASSLGPRERIQYVSTNEVPVLTYDFKLRFLDPVA
jgi:hypothetical protein